MVPLQRRHRHNHLTRPAAPCHRRCARPRDHLSNGRRQEIREEGVRNGDIDGDRRDVVRHRHRHRQARRTRAGCKGWSRRRSVQRVHVSVPSTCTGRGSAGDGIDGNAAARGVNKGAAGFTRGTGCCVCACVSLGLYGDTDSLKSTMFSVVRLSVPIGRDPSGQYQVFGAEGGVRAREAAAAHSGVCISLVSVVGVVLCVVRRCCFRANTRWFFCDVCCRFIATVTT